jgi:hypothetical protein
MPFMIWNLIPAPWRLGLSIGLLVVLLGGAAGLYFTVRAQAYNEGYGRARVECEAEKQAQADANNKVIRDAEKRLFEAADTLSLKNMELDDAIDGISAAAVASPGSDTVCLDADSLRRLNTIR